MGGAYGGVSLTPSLLPSGHTALHFPVQGPMGLPLRATQGALSFLGLIWSLLRLSPGVFMACSDHGQGDRTSPCLGCLM